MADARSRQAHSRSAPVPAGDHLAFDVLVARKKFSSGDR
jgi:hypothetical protein